VNLANVTHKSLTQSLGQEVPEVYVVIAKHQTSGFSNEQIAEIIGCESTEIDEIESDELFTTVRQTLGAMVAANQADQAHIWDSLEVIAGRRLLDRIEMERDPEFLLKVAATANRMNRRAKPQGGVLDPIRTGKAAVTLTSRMVEKITAAGHRSVMSERTLSIHDGSMANPTFAEVDELLAIRGLGLKPARIAPQEEMLDIDDLDKATRGIK